MCQLLPSLCHPRTQRAPMTDFTARAKELIENYRYQSRLFRAPQLTLNQWLENKITAALQDAFDAGRVEEREACAVIADSHAIRSTKAGERAEKEGRTTVASHRQSDAERSEMIALEIRTRGETP